MGRGRPRKPVEQKIIEGTFRKDRDKDVIGVNHLEKIPSAPAYFSAGAKQYWVKLSKILIERNTLSEGDLVGLEVLCNSLGFYRECCEIIKKEGVKAYLSERNSQTSLELGTMNKLAMIIKTWCSIFGLSPADRTKIPGIKKPKEDDPMAKFF